MVKIVVVLLPVALGVLFEVMVVLGSLSAVVVTVGCPSRCSDNGSNGYTRTS